MRRMTAGHKGVEGHPNDDQGSGVLGELLLGVGGFVLFILVTFSLMVTLTSARGGATLGETMRSIFGAGQPTELTIVHTNDTWGYLNDCG